MSYYEEFIGDNIIIRKAKASDVKAMYKNIWSDELVACNMFWPVTKSLKDAKERLERSIIFQKDKPAYFIALKENDEPIGMCGIKEEKEGIYSEAGFCIARKYQHKGYGKEMFKLLLDYSFNILNAKEFIYYCMTTNEVSKKLALHFGFIYDSANTEIRSFDQKEFLIERYKLSKEGFVNKYFF